MVQPITSTNKPPLDPFDDNSSPVRVTNSIPSYGVGNLFEPQGMSHVLTVNMPAMPTRPLHSINDTPLQQPPSVPGMGLAAQVQPAASIPQFVNQPTQPAQAMPIPPSPVTHIISPAILQGQTAPTLPAPSETITTYAVMVAPVQQILPTTVPTSGPPNGAPNLQIYEWPVPRYPPHSISPQVVFENYSIAQIEKLYRTRTPSDILIILYNKGFADITLSTTSTIQNILKVYFRNLNLPNQVAKPYLIVPLSPPHHMPFIFYGRGLAEDQKKQILREAFLPTTMELLLFLDPDDFVMDFALTINGFNLPSTEEEQRIVEKLLKDALYHNPKVFTFLQTIAVSVEKSDISLENVSKSRR
ncbi:hypothetical protein EDD85DRAFT_943432 [Armillaria nabsnona]|nr:hypothetical protein EDD85DRAFT_943432 [Armillaria nabsnona]